MSRQSGTDPQKAKMVRWYNPCQLVKTGWDVVASAILGTRADYRLIESFVSPGQEEFD